MGVTSDEDLDRLKMKELQSANELLTVKMARISAMAANQLKLREKKIERLQNDLQNQKLNTEAVEREKVADQQRFAKEKSLAEFAVRKVNQELVYEKSRSKRAKELLLAESQKSAALSAMLSAAETRLKEITAKEEDRKSELTTISRTVAAHVSRFNGVLKSDDPRSLQTSQKRRRIEERSRRMEELKQTGSKGSASGSSKKVKMNLSSDSDESEGE